MTIRACNRKPEVHAMLQRGQWPAGCTAELREHISTCRTCTETANIGSAIMAARQDSIAKVRLEPAELIWWRAQLRKRQSALARVSKPIQRAQIFTVALAVCAAIALVALISVEGWRTWFAAGISAAGLGQLLTIGALLILLTGVVVYLTIQRD